MNLCSLDYCDRPRAAKGLCHSHWKQQYQGRPLAPFRETHRGEPCTVEGCDRVRHAKGLCVTHMTRKRLGKSLSSPVRKAIQPGEAGKWTNNGGGYMRRSHRLLDGSYIQELQHRVVMAEVLGRPLLPNETPHHINGVRHDNRPENLELWVKSQPAGQRAIDLLAWAREIINTYEELEDKL